MSPATSFAHSDRGLDGADEVSRRGCGLREQHSVVAALRLALGRPVDVDALDWVAVLAIALRERLAGVAWLRASDAIRASAPRDVVDRWRTLAVVIDQRGRDRLAALGRALAALESEGIQPVVLKGMPLSQRLYGDPFVRASDDIDLFVPAADRARSRVVLQTIGWHPVDGAAPWDELFALADSSRTYLEVHEMLVTDYLAHLRLPPPETQTVPVGDLRLRAYSGSAEPAYLAAHLAGHQLTPLLWGIDYLTLWAGLDQSERDRARYVANEIGLGRYLRWALEFASTVSVAADGDRSALSGLGVRGSERIDRHFSVWRHARLAAHPFDAARAVGACVWPRPIRWNLAAFSARVAWAVRYRGHGRERSAKAREREVIQVAGGEPGASPPSSR